MTICKNTSNKTLSNVFWKTTLLSLVAVSQSIFSFADEQTSAPATNDWENAQSILNEPDVTENQNSPAPSTATEQTPTPEQPQEEAAPQTMSSAESNAPMPMQPQEDSIPQPICCEVELNSRVSIGVNYTYVTLQPHGHNSFHGSLGGAQGSYEYMPLNSFYGGAKIAWKEGTTRGDSGKRSLLYFDAQERLGYTYGSEENDWQVTLFSGFGYRHLYQHLEPKTGGSLRFHYNEFYLPVGFLGNYDMSSCFSFGLDFTWMPQIYPTVTIVPLRGARWILTNRLDNFYVAAPLTYALTDDKNWLLTFNPFFEHWADGHSTAKLLDGTSLGLPSNTYNFYGVDLNVVYAF